MTKIVKKITSKADSTNTKKRKEDDMLLSNCENCKKEKAQGDYRIMLYLGRERCFSISCGNFCKDCAEMRLRYLIDQARKNWIFDQEFNINWHLHRKNGCQKNIGFNQALLDLGILSKNAKNCWQIIMGKTQIFCPMLEGHPLFFRKKEDALSYANSRFFGLGIEWKLQRVYEEFH